MTRALVRIAAAILFAVAIGGPVSVFAQGNPLSIAGTVVDDTGAGIAGARVTVTRPDGSPVRDTSTDPAGGFTIAGVAPGEYRLRVEADVFAPSVTTVTVPETGALSSLRVVLKARFTETVLVTASRVLTPATETPQKVEVVDAVDVERTVATDVADLLKKNAGVDVIQYTGALSGVGLRGFRPQTSGINKRMLLLADGRPSGITNLATLLLDNIERVEVLKGAASALYGSSAMGGVVNVITRRSTGRVGGNVRIGAGSYDTVDVAGRAGGSVSSRLDFDVTARALDQRGDITMGNGVTRPSTSYAVYAGSGRLGADLTPAWRAEGLVDAYRGRDIESPPDLASGTVGQTLKDIERGAVDLRLSGTAGVHALSFGVFSATEASHTSNVTTFNPADLPFLPFLSFESDLRWTGAQVRDAFTWLRANRLIVGLDVEHVSSESRSFSRTGDRTAPFSADSTKQTIGAYFENTLRVRDNRTIVSVGGRGDRITTATLETPFKTNFEPSESTFTVFNPSVGFKHEIGGGLRVHFAAGRAFIPAEAIMLTGLTTTVIGGRGQISQGNPDLKPERSTSVDAGAEWIGRRTRLDVTAFRTVVKDRFISNVVISNPPPPGPIVVSIVNGLDAHITGVDFEVEHRLNRRTGVFANVTHYFTRKERLPSGAEQDILNVAESSLRLGVDLDLWRLRARVGGRYVAGRRDNDFNAPGFPIVDYENFTVIDATIAYQLARAHAVSMTVNNVFDAFYYEKLGYPLQGVSFKLSYHLGVGR